MAYCKTIQKQIKTETHIVDALNYVIGKASKVTYINENILFTENLTPQRIQSFYRTTREEAEKYDGILAHHLIQSFSSTDNIDVETAHNIGKELIERCLSYYQVTLATHNDGACIHNHLIINSVSPVDGKKFRGNQNTIKKIRQTSDDICLKYNLDIITQGTQSKYKGLDNETLQTAKQGKSWKIQLVKDLDESFEKCSTKTEFIEFFKSKNYEIKFTEKNITFKKNGFDKGIRADTLAKQFGTKYGKASIEFRMNISAPERKQSHSVKRTSTKVNVSKQVMKLNRFAVEDWKREQQIHREKYRPYNYSKKFPRVSFSKNPMRFTLSLIRCFFSSHKKKRVANLRIVNKQTYRINTHTNYEKQKQIVSNVNYYRLIESGNTAQIKLYSWQIAKLLDNNILFSSKIDLTSGTALVTVKEFDLDKIANILNISEEQLQNQKEVIHNRRVTYNIKKQPEEKIEYLVIDKEFSEKLTPFSLDIAKYPREDGKINIAFSSKDKDKILSILYPERKENNNDSFYLRNVKINRELKEYAEENNIKLNYKIVVNSQYAKLKSCNIKYAVFKQKDGRYNIVFLETDKSAINKLITVPKKPKPPEKKIPDGNNIKL